MTVGAGYGELGPGLVEGNVFDGSRLFAQAFHALVFDVYEVYDEFTAFVSDQIGRLEPHTYSLATAIQLPSGLRATSRTGSVVLTKISSNLPLSSENLLTVPSSEPVMK